MLLTCLPAAADLGVGAFYRSPGNTVRSFLLSVLTGMRGKSEIERLAINILRMWGKVRPHRFRQIIVCAIRHRPSRFDKPSIAPLRQPVVFAPSAFSGRV